MSGRISYMGTKHELSARVLSVTERCRPGRLMDAFSGMGAVAEAHMKHRNVWANDVQHYAHLASLCRLADPGSPPSAASLATQAKPLFRENLKRLEEQNVRSFRLTRHAIAADEFIEFERAFHRSAEQSVTTEQAFGCFTKTYSHGYFSIRQCAEIDSIRYALEVLRGRGILSQDHFNWSLLALGRAILRLANTTGHFAQFLTPSRTNFGRVTKQFRRSVWKEWLLSSKSLRPVGTSNWRSSNVVTRSDSTSMLRDPTRAGAAQVVYCDPPYTDDQYSRYYHIWETLVLYDYPVVTGKGRYRGGRFTTDFSLASKVEAAFEQLIRDVADIEADLVLSYPSNGLLHKIGGCPLDIIRRRYPKSEVAMEVAYNHSTMGASKGVATAAVTERIYLGRL
jgi:adenine-specific DNA-methyltransferase